MIVGVTGHDVERQRDAMRRAIAAATEGKEATGFAVMEGDLHEPDDQIPYIMDHAGTWETSCMMYACPDKVNLEELRKYAPSSEDKIDFGGPEGMRGWNPVKYASAELGQRIIGKMADLIGAKARAALAELEKTSGAR